MRRWNCTRCGGDVSDFQQHAVAFDAEWDLLAMTGFWPRWQALFVIFRGTDSANLGNWIHNVNILKTAYYRVPFPGASSSADRCSIAGNRHLTRLSRRL